MMVMNRDEDVVMSESDAGAEFESEGESESEGEGDLRCTKVKSDFIVKEAPSFIQREKDEKRVQQQQIKGTRVVKEKQGRRQTAEKAGKVKSGNLGKAKTGMRTTKERYIDKKKRKLFKKRKTREGSEPDNQTRWYRSEVIRRGGWQIDMSRGSDVAEIAAKTKI
ncbi:hypothetical protein K438DRAFT_1775530 [Mycena galopus ATCC 62051]|nr:hypothetical protein K438DRAFT_1775530 [Mycena galopus ATCC 62051]